MGEDVDVRDLETVESEIMTRLATNEAEKAMESISAGLEAETAIKASSKELIDFNIDELLSSRRNERFERSERTEFVDNESEEEDEEEEDYSKEMNDFINDHSDESEREDEDDEFRDFEMKPNKKVKRRITFNFSDDEEEFRESEYDDKDKEEEHYTALTDVNDNEIEAPVKKRNISVIMESDSD
jgi:hypothetical protein